MKAVRIKTLLLLCVVAVSCSFPDPRNGAMEEFYPNGSIKASYTLKDGKREGLYKEFDAYGRLAFSAEYKNDKRNGKFSSFDPKNSKPSIVSSFVNDTQQGPLTHFYANGNIFRTCNYEKGHINGVSKTYWPNGKVKVINTYENGLPAMGIREFTKEGKEVQQPYIVVKEIDQMALLNKYIVKIYLSDNATDVDFYEGALVHNTFFPDKNYNHKIKSANGQIVMAFDVDRGASVYKDYYITAKLKTKLGNTLFLYKSFKLFVINE